MKGDTIIIHIEKSEHKTFKYKGLTNFLIFENNKKVNLSQYVATFFFKFPSNKVVEIKGEIENDMIKLLLPNDFFIEKGLIMFEINLKSKEQRITTFKMYLQK